MQFKDASGIFKVQKNQAMQASECYTFLYQQDQLLRNLLYILI